MAEFKTILRKEEIVLPVDSIILPDKENRIYRALEKILKQLKFGEEKETFLTILEKLLDLGRGSVQTRYNSL